MSKEPIKGKLLLAAQPVCWQF